MKKAILTVTLCILLLCITACGNTNRSTAAFDNTMEFASSEEMLKHLDGMWVVDADAAENSYYIFRDGQIYITTDTMYSAQVKNMLDNALQNGGVEALYNQDFASVSKRMYLSDVSITPNAISLFPQNGEIKMYEGQYDEKSVVITEESVLLTTSDTENGTVMTKLSDAADFSMERFEEIYNEVTENYAVPTSQLWLGLTEYGEMVKTKIPQFDWWVDKSTSDIEAYAPSGGISTLDGSGLVITKQSLEFVYKINVASWNDSYEPTLTIEYNPGKGSFLVHDKDNNALNLLSLVQYGAYAVQNFPGAYTDPVELYNAIANTELVTADGITNKKELTVNGLTYSLCVGTDGTWGQFSIEANDTIHLVDVLKSRQETTEDTETVTTPTQSGTMEQLLDSTKSWVGLWELDGWEYNVHFVFNQDGDCYFALSSETELFGAGLGTYTVKDGNKLSVSMKMDGEKHSVTYAFNPEDFSLTVASKKGLVAEKGDVVFLREDTDIDVETVEGWAERLAEGLSEEDEDLLWG